jgi:molybdopterin biosynthesis enzyme
MRPFTETLPFADAIRIVLDAASPIERTESVTLADADGRIAATDLVAAVDVPPFDRAAMDGYAVVAHDTALARAGSPVPLVCVDRVFTGQVPARGVGAGECIEIATGAPMPSGADAVVIVEDTIRDGDRISVMKPVSERQNIGPRAADIDKLVTDLKAEG